MYLKHLWYLQLVVQHGSQAAAARAAGVTQSAIAQAMQALQRHWGVALFERAGRRLLPTAAALDAARRAFEMQRGGAGPAQSWDLAAPAAAAPELRVAMASAAALLYAPELERIWHEHRVDGSLRIMAATGIEPLAAVIRSDLDLAIVPRPRGWRDDARLRSKLLHTSAPLVLARRGHPQARARSLAQIAACRWGVAGHAGTAGSTIEEAHRVRGWPPPQVLLHCGDYRTLLNIVARSDLLCALPHRVLLATEDSDRLVQLPLREGLPRYEVCVFWRPANEAQLAPVLQALQPLAA